MKERSKISVSPTVEGAGTSKKAGGVPFSQIAQ